MEPQEYTFRQDVGTTNFVYRVYAWMSFALAITASVSYYIAQNEAISSYVQKNTWLLISLFILQLALVVMLSAFIMRLSLFTAVLSFIVYAISVGITLSFIFAVFTTASIYATFIVTAGMFLITCLYGYFTKADLTSLGSFGFMALIGLILGGFVNWFLKSPGFDFVLSAAGVLVFTLLTAYDAQKIKQMGNSLMRSEQTRKKVAILGALTLYLDFINLFLYLLRFMGKRKES